MSPSELKYHVDLTGSHFFNRRSMAFFGDRMSNYGVRPKPVTIETWTRKAVTCWELFRKRPVKYGMAKSAYFEIGTFERVIPQEG